MKTIKEMNEIIKEANFRIKRGNGTDCYKMVNGRYYTAFVHNYASLNANVKYVRISKSDYELAMQEHDMIVLGY